MPYKAYTDRTGERYGRLLVVSPAGTRDHTRVWLCRCDCGTLKEVTWKQIQQNHARSCGCLQREAREKSGGHNVLPPGESAFNQLFASYQKSARERGYEFHLTAADFRTLTQSDCYYCGAGPAIKFHAAAGTNGDYIGNGIDRIDNAQGYVLSNVRPCCKQCNIAKGVLTEADFLAWIMRAYQQLHGERGRRS